MTKIITMTYLLKNPAKVRSLVKQGVSLLVKYENEIVMKIDIPTEHNKNNNKNLKLPPYIKNIGKTDFEFNREEIYDKEY
jgi:hypothetical protein